MRDNWMNVTTVGGLLPSGEYLRRKSGFLSRGLSHCVRVDANPGDRVPDWPVVRRDASRVVPSHEQSGALGTRVPIRNGKRHLLVSKWCGVPDGIRHLLEGEFSKDFTRRVNGVER